MTVKCIMTVPMNVCEDVSTKNKGMAIKRLIEKQLRADHNQRTNSNCPFTCYVTLEKSLTLLALVSPSIKCRYCCLC